MVGLGRAVGAGGDLVVLWSPGTSGGVVEEAVRVLCLQARRAVSALLDAARIVEADLDGRRAVEAAFDSTVQREC